MSCLINIDCLCWIKIWSLYLQPVLNKTPIIGYDPQPIKLCSGTLILSFQILTSVQPTSTTVITMLSVITLRDLINARVALGTMEMEHLAPVNYYILTHWCFLFYLISISIFLFLFFFFCFCFCLFFVCVFCLFFFVCLFVCFFFGGEGLKYVSAAVLELELCFVDPFCPRHL